MESILIGGAQSVGKTTIIYRLASRLLNNGFSYDKNSPHLTAPYDDFMIVLEGNDKSGKFIRIIINSATDTVDIIQLFKDFYDKHGSYDILISSVRDKGHWPRKEFFNIMKLNQNVLEIPLGKVTRRKNKGTAKQWYLDTMDTLIDTILGKSPYNI